MTTTSPNLLYEEVVLLGWRSRFDLLQWRSAKLVPDHHRQLYLSKLTKSTLLQPTNSSQSVNQSVSQSVSPLLVQSTRDCIKNNSTEETTFISTLRSNQRRSIRPESINRIESVSIE